MFKKIVLMSILSALATPEKAHSLDDKETVTAVMVCAGALGTIVYWANRESNDSLIARAKLLIEENRQLCNQAEMYVNQNFNFSSSDLNPLQDNLNSFQTKLLVVNNQLKSIYTILNDRYNSSLTPWNWSDKMLQASSKVKAALEVNKVANISVQGLLGRVNYLHCLKTYQYALGAANGFVVENRNIWQQKISLFGAINSLQELCESKEAIKAAQIELDQFFAKYKELDAQLKKIVYSLHMQDRNIHIETDFSILGQQAESLSHILNQHSKFLNMYLKYKACLTHMNSEYLLIKEARKIVGGSSYPLKDFIVQLDHEINVLKSMNTKVTVYAQIVIDSLIEIRNTLIASNEYITELRSYEVYLEQKRQAEAAIRAARAAEEAANAARHQAQAAQEAADTARRQARAAEEQNRLKKEQNRIDQERNDLERRKQRDNRNNDNRW